MRSRVLTAVPLALGVVALVWWGPIWLYVLVLLLAIELSLREFFSLARAGGFAPLAALGYILAAALCLAPWAALSTPAPWVAFAGLATLGLVLVSALFSCRDLRSYFGSTAATLLGIAYIGFALSWLVPLRFASGERGRRAVLFLFLVVWAGDILALFVGRGLGRHPLVARISPKKTVEGAIGGFLGSLAVACASKYWFWQTLDLKTAILLGGLLSIAGQFGDLVESALKRSVEVKDSGTLLPGHGGLLDRIDSLIFSAPVLWAALAIGDRLHS